MNDQSTEGKTMFGAFLDVLWKGFLDRVSATQICWLCLAGTMGMAWMVTTKYATAGEIAEVRAQIIDMKVADLEKEMIDIRMRQCQPQADKRFFRERLSDLLGKYRRLTGQSFDLPACEEL